MTSHPISSLSALNDASETTGAHDPLPACSKTPKNPIKEEEEEAIDDGHDEEQGELDNHRNTISGSGHLEQPFGRVNNNNNNNNSNSKPIVSTSTSSSTYSGTSNSCSRSSTSSGSSTSQNSSTSATYSASSENNCSSLAAPSIGTVKNQQQTDQINDTNSSIGHNDNGCDTNREQINNNTISREPVRYHQQPRGSITKGKSSI